MGAQSELDKQAFHRLLDALEEATYLKLQDTNDRILDITPHDCELCGLQYGGFDLVAHIHVVHNLEYSDICPCDDCVFVQLSEMSGGDGHLTGEHSASSRQTVNGNHVAQSRHISAATNIRKSQQHYAPVKVSPSGPSLTKNAAQGALARQETLARMGSSEVIRLDSMSPVQKHPPQFISAESSKSKNKRTPTKSTQHTRVDSAHSTKSMSAPSAVIKPNQPVKGQLKLVPDNVMFCQTDGQLSERNLPYELSKIESGKMHEDNGRVVWIDQKLDQGPTWLDGDDNTVVSIATGKNMLWVPVLPHSISKEVPAWQITCWIREAASQGLYVRHQDLIDRGLALTSSGITSRLQSWQRGIGMLSQSRTTHNHWPPRQAMETVAGLTYNQARFNTWWDVGFVASHNVWIVRQPGQHPGYKDWASLSTQGPKTTPPYYFVENPESRKVSEYIKLVDDAMLFLTIKAEECGMESGYHELLSWFAKEAGDQWTRDLETDLVLEFGRWREGCPDTPSISVLRVALEQAGSMAEVEAIKRADYSLTPWLQDVDRGLTPLKESRRSKDEQKKSTIATKVAKQIIGKRKAEDLDHVEMWAGQAKKRAA